MMGGVRSDNKSNECEGKVGITREKVRRRVRGGKVTFRGGVKAR